jgi:hypothetical protein
LPGLRTVSLVGHVRFEQQGLNRSTAEQGCDEYVLEWAQDERPADLHMAQPNDEYLASLVRDFIRGMD